MSSREEISSGGSFEFLDLSDPNSFPHFVSLQLVFQ